MSQYIIFLLETITIVLAVLLVLFGFFAMMAASKRDKGMAKGALQVKPIAKQFNKLKLAMLRSYDKKAYKAERKSQQKHSKNDRNKPRCFVIDFKGDLYASGAESLRHEISAVLLTAKDEDEVVVIINSPGGAVSGYGYAASQLKRVTQAGLKLTVLVDQVAASGGYLMASVADTIVAAPFSIIGSIGVVGQLPNFHAWLKERGIAFEQVTAGEYKRTLTMFGENTEAGRQKFKEDLELIHRSFKQFIVQKRPSLKLSEVATGEHWLAIDALSLGLVDELSTSDDWLFKKYLTQQSCLIQVQYHMPRNLFGKLANKGASLLTKLSSPF